MTADAGATQTNGGTSWSAKRRSDPSKPMVLIDHVSKTFPGGTQAVKDESLQIMEGEVFTLLGPSGCGKTTTLRMVAGLESPETGSIYFKDRPIVVTDQRLFVPPNKRAVGMVFQSYAIWPHMTVEENVAYPLKLRGVPRGERQDRVKTVLGLVGMDGLQKRQAPLLSGGQQQRVALARALVYEPEVLLLDEPFSNLDTKLREQMRLELKLLQRRLGITVLFVTHDQIEALSLSNRIAVMNFGEVQQVGTPHEMYEAPANPFVRDFLGKTVLLKGKVSATNEAGQVAVAVDGAPNCVVFGRSYLPDEVPMGEAVYMAMRPDDLGLSAADSRAAPAGTVEGEVENLQFLGERTEYQVRVNEQGSVLAYGGHHEILPEGGKVRLKINADTVSVWPIGQQESSSATGGAEDSGA